MTGEKKTYKPSISEGVLFAILILLLALTRIYIGGGNPPMVVWKGELTFHDTLVDLDDIAKLPREELLKDHRSVLCQLEDMNLIETNDGQLDRIRHRQWQGRKKAKQAALKPEQKPAEESAEKTEKEKEPGEEPAPAAGK